MTKLEMKGMLIVLKFDWGYSLCVCVRAHVCVRVRACACVCVFVCDALGSWGRRCVRARCHTQLKITPE